MISVQAALPFPKFRDLTRAKTRAMGDSTQGAVDTFAPSVRAAVPVPSPAKSATPRVPQGLAVHVASAMTSYPAVVVAAPATTAEVVQTNYNGSVVSDPYRWLENSTDLAVTEWVTAQNAYTEKVLSAQPGRTQVTDRLQQILNAGSLGAPAPVGDKLLYFRRNGLQNQPALYQRKADGSEQVLLDPNTWSSDGTVALDWDFPTQDGRYIAYGRSTGGTELSTMHILDTQTMTELDEKIPNTRAASVAWLPDNSGFYYTRYPQAGTVPPGQENYFRKV